MWVVSMAELSAVQKVEQRAVLKAAQTAVDWVEKMVDLTVMPWAVQRASRMVEWRGHLKVEQMVHLSAAQLANLWAAH
jgi:hypothetical protein